MTAYVKYAALLRGEVKDAPIDKGSFDRRLARCTSCNGFCCSDGVALEEDEPAILEGLARDEKEFFASVGVNLPEKLIVPDPDDPTGDPKIATLPRPFSKMVPNFPKHFTDTACAFLTDKGWCSLQMLSVARGLHKWHYKPMVCWMFPLSPYGGNLTYKIHVKSDAAENNEPGRPGFVEHTGCGETICNGTPARELLHEEITYFSELFGRDIFAELDESAPVTDSIGSDTQPT